MRQPVINPRGNCIGCGNCQAVAPAVFRLGSDGKAEVIKLPDYEHYATNIDRAISECPVNIIKWQN